MTISEYLVKLGFRVDESGQRKFATAIAVQTVALQELAKGLEEVAQKAVAFVARISDELEKLYFTSQRTKASAQNIQAVGFAAGQMGSSIEGATASLENLARFMRTRPAGENYIQGLGVRTRQTNGELRDTTDILQDLGKKFAGMPQFRAQRLADILGIDEKTMFALREGVGQFSGQYLDMLKAVGMDSQSAAKASHELMNAFRTLSAMGTILTSKFAAALGAKLKKPLEDLLQKWFLAKLPAIGKLLEWLAGVFGLVVESIVRFAGMVVNALSSWWGWIQRLDPALRKFIFTITALGAAFLLLSNPIALIAALGAAIFLLIDDYQTWQRGGKSLINWGQWDAQIQAAIQGITQLRDAFVGLETAVVKILGPAFAQIVPQLKDWAKTGFGDLLDMILLNTVLLQGRFADAAKRAGDIVARTGAAFVRAGNRGMEAGVAVADNVRNVGQPRGIRNNNPGNIEYGEFARSQGATGVEAKGRFAVFPDAQAGLNATAALLRKYAAQGIDTINSIIAKWAPPGENDTGAYAAGVSKRLGVSGTQHLNLNDPKIMEGLIGSITVIENGKNPYSREQVARAAGATTSTTDSSKAVTIHQSNVTTITGSSDPAAMAKQNDRAKSSNNEMLIRQLLPALQ